MPNTGPLAGVKVVEMAGIGPGPMAAMLLADMGATVLRIDRKEPSGLGINRPLKFNLLLRNRGVIALDLKNPADRERTLTLIDRADALIEGFRPGVMERLGLGPEVCLARNARLAYGRMTGWGQIGPLAQTAGHDIGYIAITGVLNAIGRRDAPPSIPLNLIGDFGGGALYLAMGLLAAILSARSTGRGQVVDAAIVDGTASLATSIFGTYAAGMLPGERGTNMMDSGSHYYDVYQCADGRWLSVGALEPKFYAELLRILEIDPATLGPQNDPASWPRAKQILASKFRSRNRDDWAALFAASDACVAPVLDWDEAAAHPQLQARDTLVTLDGIVQPAPAPRFSHTPNATPSPPQANTPDQARAALASWLNERELAAWQAAGVCA
jgi:alpha-methylacyl-CoA racemase